jgi:CheY-like chemotaxis protein
LLFDSLMNIFGVEVQPAQRAAVPSDAAAVASLDPLRGARILLVEDNEINQQVAMEMLESENFLVDLAADGLQAIDQVSQAQQQNRPYDLVLMDMQMPVMDGVTASRQIRRDATHAALPIVAMTANAMEADRQLCLSAGMNDFVTKPIEPKNLWAALGKWIRPREGLGQVHKSAEAKPAVDYGILQALAQVAGLDAKAGLSRSSGNADLYLQMLKRFVKSQENTGADLRRLVNGADMASAERIAHTLRGVAGNLGVTGLQEDARQLESALRHASPVFEILGLVDSTARSLASVRDALKAALGLQADVLPELGAVDAARELEALRRYLERDDAQAVDTFHKLQARLRSFLGDALFGQVEAALEGFAFDEALALLNRSGAFGAVSGAL